MHFHPLTAAHITAGKWALFRGKTTGYNERIIVLYIIIITIIIILPRHAYY